MIALSKSEPKQIVILEPIDDTCIHVWDESQTYGLFSWLDMGLSTFNFMCSSKNA